MKIITGDPYGNEAASFSRFVLPFRYCLTPCDDAGRGPVFRQLGVPGGGSIPDMSARHAYFTEETGKALFDRCGWFELSVAPDDLPSKEAAFLWSFTFPSAGGKTPSLFVRTHPPRLVLFELASASPGEERAFDSGSHLDLLHTGFLLVDVSFKADPSISGGETEESASAARSFEDLLRFNEVFRYWRAPFRGHYQQHYLPALREHLRSGASEAAQYLERWAGWLRAPVEHGGDRFRLFSDKSDQQALAWVEGSSRESGWICYADNRTFVWSCAVSERGLAHLDSRAAPKPAERAAWVRFLNVDPPGGLGDSATDFERHWAEERTYGRWAHFGSVYGFNYHAAAAIVPPITNPQLWRNWLWLYFDPILLLLYLRVSAFRFSSRLSRISRDWIRDGKPQFRDRVKELARLREAFAALTNLYRFPLVSNQQQAVEMYDQAKRAMDVEELFQEVRERIAATHEFHENLESSEHSRFATILGLVGAAGLAITFAITLLQHETVAEGMRGGVFSVGGLREWLLILAAVFGSAVVVALLVGFARWLTGSEGRFAGWLRMWSRKTLIVLAVLLAMTLALVWLRLWLGSLRGA